MHCIAFRHTLLFAAREDPQTQIPDATLLAVEQQKTEHKSHHVRCRTAVALDNFASLLHQLCSLMVIQGFCIAKQKGHTQKYKRQVVHLDIRGKEKLTLLLVKFLVILTIIYKNVNKVRPAVSRNF